MKRFWRLEGFTLTELMVTLGIVAVVSGLAFTGYYAFVKSHNLYQETYILYQDLESIRERALSLGVQHVVVFDTESGTYRALRRDTLILERTLRGGVSFSLLDEIQSGGCGCETQALTPITFENDTLIFTGRGTATPGCIYLSDGKKQTAIFVNPLGKIKICRFYGGSWHE